MNEHFAFWFAGIAGACFAWASVAIEGRHKVAFAVAAVVAVVVARGLA